MEWRKLKGRTVPRQVEDNSNESSLFLSLALHYSIYHILKTYDNRPNTQNYLLKEVCTKVLSYRSGRILIIPKFD